MLGALERDGTSSPSGGAGACDPRRKRGVHGNSTPSPTAMRRLRDAYGLSGWYARNVERGSKVTPEATPPTRLTALPPEETGQRSTERARDRIEGQRRPGSHCSRSGRTRTPRAFEGATASSSGLLEMVAVAAGEPLIDAEFNALVMAMDRGAYDTRHSGRYSTGATQCGEAARGGEEGARSQRAGVLKERGAGPGCSCSSAGAAGEV